MNTTPNTTPNRPTARDVRCPFCLAAPTQPCRERRGGIEQAVSVHLARVAAAVATVTPMDTHNNDSIPGR